MSEEAKNETKCDCAEKGIKISYWDIAGGWTYGIDETGREVVTGQRSVHTPCGREIEYKVYVV